MDTVITREETETTIVLARVTGHRFLYDGAVSSYVRSDRLPGTDGRIIRSNRLSLIGVLTPADRKVEDDLVALRDSGEAVEVAIPGLPPIGSMQVQILDLTGDNTDGRTFVLDLVEKRVARSRRVNVAPNAQQGAPRAALADGLSEERDLGERPRSLLTVGIDQLAGLLP